MATPAEQIVSLQRSLAGNMNLQQSAILANRQRALWDKHFAGEPYERIAREAEMDAWMVRN